MLQWLQNYTQSPVKKKSEVKLRDAPKRPGSGRGKPAQKKSGKAAALNDDDSWTCKKCQVVFTDETDEVITCSFCDHHWCTKCIEMTTDEYMTAQRLDLLWFCPPCHVKVKVLMNQDNDADSLCNKILETVDDKIKKMSVDLEKKLKESVNKIPEAISKDFGDKVTNLEKNLKAVTEVPEKVNNTCKTWAEAAKGSKNVAPPNFQNIVKTAIDESKKEEKDVEDRKRNIIVFNAEESKSEVAEDRKSDDITLFTSICHSISDSLFVYDEDNDDEVIQARRLGKKHEDGTPRPLLVTVGSEDTKRKIFANLYKLRNTEDATFKEIGMNHDMTKEERKKTKLLVEEAKQKTARLAENPDLDEESKNFVFRVRGPPWSQEIIKVRKRF